VTRSDQTFKDWNRDLALLLYLPARGGAELVRPSE
jgi:hypothetical protein